ncbi:MAG TPA: YfhO family protein [Pyrinomonadaceae bacterium]|nr:YfhO family protein [Pyrinomonadaceae bacterium]
MFQVSTTTKASARHALLVLLFFSVLFTIFFSPVLFYDSLLTPQGPGLGDGLLYHLTFFQSHKVLWDPLLATGYPMMADPQVMTWYPPSVLLSLIPGTWNAFVVSAYVMAGCFAYGYVYTLTESRLAGLVSGIAYSMCGFMFAHLGHTAIIHSAVWLPLIVWSLECLRRRGSRGWLLICSLAVACNVLAGHLQIVVYSLAVGCAYALVLGWTAPVGRRRFYRLSICALLLGAGLSALQLLPTAELASLSTRTDFLFSDFISYSLPLKQIPLLLFPAVFGGLPHYGTTPYFGEWNITELTGYVGLLPLLLAAIGFIVSRRKAVSIFWAAIGITALLLALGNLTPLASLAYHLPIVNRFRAPARHLFEAAFAVSVLAGIGAHAIFKREATRRLLSVTIAAGAGVMGAGVLILLSSKLSRYALSKGVAHLDALPWSNAAVGTPLLIFTAAVGAMLYYSREPASYLRRGLLLTVLVIDLASFGWFYSWHDFAAPKTVLNPPAAAAKYRDLLGASRQRMLSVRGTMAAHDEFPPNLSRLWGVPNATVYGPLTISRLMQLSSMLQDGSIASTWKHAGDKSLNVLAVRYVFLPKSELLKDERGISWEGENMDIWLGAGCDHPPSDAVKFNLPAPAQATTLYLVSRLACAVGLKDGEEVARVLVTDADGTVQTESLLAGRDTSEWSYDCRTIKPQVQHREAVIYNSFPASMYDEPCAGHFYLTKINLLQARSISSIELQWAGRSGAMTLEKLSLLDESTGNSEAVGPLSINGSQWRFVEETGGARVYENAEAMPRAWLAPEVINLKPEEILLAIKTARLPDGRAFDPAQTALVEDSPALPARSTGTETAASVQLTQASGGFLEARTSSAAPSFLVTSDAYYPGWQASVDGTPVPVFRADYALRGVQVPAGEHTVRFEFRPKTFYYGAAISALSALILAVFLIYPAIRRKYAET